MPSRKTVLAAALVACATACAFGWTRFWSYVRASRDALQEFVGQNVPMDLERTRIVSLIVDEERRSEAFEDRLADIKARRAALADAQRAAAQEIDDDKALLGRIKTMLDERRSEYTIASRSYSHAEVNADALLRAADLEQKAAALEGNQRLVADLDAAIQSGRGSLAQARQRLGSLRVALAALEARDAGAEARLQARAIINAIQCSPLGVGTELEAAMSALKARVERKERRAASTSDGGRIDWDGTIASRSGSEEIDRVLKAIDGPPGGAPIATVAAPGAEGGRATDAGGSVAGLSGDSEE